MDVDLQMTTMIVGEEESITLNRTIVSGHFTFWIAYVNTTTEVTIVWAFFVIASFGILGSLVTMGNILYEPKLHTPTFAVIKYFDLTDFFSVITCTFTFLILLIWLQLWNHLPYVFTRFMWIHPFTWCYCLLWDISSQFIP